MSNWFRDFFRSWEDIYLSKSIDHADLKRRMKDIEDRRRREILFTTYNYQEDLMGMFSAALFAIGLAGLYVVALAVGFGLSKFHR